MERQREALLALGRSRFNVEPEYLFAKYPEIAVLRHPISRKWFALIEPVARSMVNVEGEGEIEVLNVKCHPVMIGGLLEEPGFRPGYHMNKNHWISVLLDSGVDLDRMAALMDLSYELVSPKAKKKRKG